MPIAPGGSTDYIARLLAQKLGERIAQPVVIDNRPGAGRNIGTDLVAKAPADGYTVVAANVSSVAINQSLYKNATTILREKDVLAQLAAQGAQAEPMGRDEFARFLRSEAAKWSSVVKASGARVDWL